MAVDFIGTVLSTPFRRGANDFVAVEDLDALQSMVGQVLGVRGGSEVTEGELLWRTEFGSILHFLRHRQNDEVTAELARVYVVESLGRWIPQIQVKDVQTWREKGPDGEETILAIRVVYDVLARRRGGLSNVLFPDVSQVVRLQAA